MLSEAYQADFDTILILLSNRGLHVSGFPLGDYNRVSTGGLDNALPKGNESCPLRENYIRLSHST